MPTTIHNTGITFPDSTIQTTAAAGGGPITTLYAIGSYTIGRPNDYNTYTVNSTVAGSSLYGLHFGSILNVNENNQYVGSPSQSLGATHVNVGSWRCVSPSPATINGMPATLWVQGLWVRYA